MKPPVQESQPIQAFYVLPLVQQAGGVRLQHLQSQRGEDSLDFRQAVAIHSKMPLLPIPFAPVQPGQIVFARDVQDGDGARAGIEPPPTPSPTRRTSPASRSAHRFATTRRG